MRIVVDTSVFISAVRSPDSAGREVLRQCLEGQMAPLMGQALFTEYEDVLGRKEPWGDSPISEAVRAELFQAFASACEWTRVYYLWRPNLIDEADNHLMELAVAGSGAAVVTFNTKHLKRGELRFPSIRILTAAELLAEV